MRFKKARGCKDVEIFICHSHSPFLHLHEDTVGFLPGPDVNATGRADPNGRRTREKGGTGAS